MLTHQLFAINGPGSVVLLVILGILALIVVNLIIALLEGVILTVVNWNPFRASMMVSAIMNLASGIINGVLLILLQQSPLLWLPVSFVISILIEWFFLAYFKRNAALHNLLIAFGLNLLSYVILILPAYYFGTNR
jgi:hypothetical protein